MRLINAVRELRLETGVDLRTIALHTAAERAAMFVREADEAVCLDADRRPLAAGTPYLDLDALERRWSRARADAAWVGWGFVAERPEFAELCDRLGIVFVGPRPDVMRALGDKIGAKLLAEQADVPVAAWSGGPVESVDDAATSGRAHRLPADGQGDRRWRRPRHPPRRRRRPARRGVRERPRRRARKAFGDPTVFMERVVTDARHVEVQMIADHHGTVWAVGVRDCSLQRRNQKVIEESHCVALTRRAGRRAAGGGRAPGRARRLHERRHRRVPLPAGRAAVRLPRGQHPPAGRAPGHRADDRARPRQAAAARRRRRAPRGRRPRRRRATPSRPGSTPRTRSAASRRRRGRSRRWCCRSGPGSASTPASPRAT